MKRTDGVLGGVFKGERTVARVAERHAALSPIERKTDLVRKETASRAPTKETQRTISAVEAESPRRSRRLATKLPSIRM